MRRLIGLAGIAALVVGLLFSPARAAAAEKSAVDMLPASTAVYVEVARPGDLIALLLDSPAAQQIEKLPQYRKALEDPKFQKFQEVIRAIEKQSGVAWRQALENGTAGGVSIAFDPNTQGVVILARSQDAKITESFRDAFFKLARDWAAKEGGGDPIEAVDYRDLKAWKLGEGVIAQIGSWLILTNKVALAQKMADQFLDGGAGLAADKQFQQSRQLSADSAAPSAWAFVRLDLLRAMGEKPPWLDPKYKSENPVLEFLVGGLAPLLRNAPYITAALTVQQDEFKLAVAAPNDLKWAAEKKFFFALPGDGAAVPLKPPGTMLSISMYRDLSAMWQSGPDLFSEDVASKMAQADSGLSNFFGGKSFGADVLGALRPQLQFVAARQDYKAAGVPVPSLRLPGGALILRIKPDKFDSVRRRFRVGFQTAVALANLDGATKGRPVLEIQTEKRGDVEIQAATYDLTDKTAAKDDIYLNFSPALVMSKNYLVLCSTKQIAGNLADLIVKEGDTLPTIAENVAIEIDAAGAAALIKDDREQLIAQNMLEKGHDRAAAEKDIDALRAIVNYFRSATLRLTPTEQSIKLEVDVKLKSVKQ